MNATTALAAALLFGSFGGALLCELPAHAASAACAGGYHADASGNCQPNNVSADTRCPAGFDAIPAMNGNGYRCVPSAHS